MEVTGIDAHGYAGENSNWWALGVGAVRGMLEACGLSGVAVVNEWTNEKISATGMSRTALVAQRPPLPLLAAVSTT